MLCQSTIVFFSFFVVFLFFLDLLFDPTPTSCAEANSQLAGWGLRNYLTQTGGVQLADGRELLHVHFILSIPLSTLLLCSLSLLSQHVRLLLSFVSSHTMQIMHSFKLFFHPALLSSSSCLDHIFLSLLPVKLLEAFFFWYDCSKITDTNPTQWNTEWILLSLESHSSISLSLSLLSSPFLFFSSWTLPLFLSARWQLSEPGLIVTWCLLLSVLLSSSLCCCGRRRKQKEQKLGEKKRGGGCRWWCENGNQGV